MDSRIMTLHPQGKAGVNIEKRKYDVMRATILEVLAEGEITFQGLTAAVEDRLVGKFDGAIGWYTTTVKLDLEARGEIERVATRSPQFVRLAQKV